MTVSDHYNIDEHMSKFVDLAAESDYWEKALDFYEEKQDESILNLSIKENDWLEKIEKDLGEMG